MFETLNFVNIRATFTINEYVFETINKVKLLECHSQLFC